MSISELSFASSNGRDTVKGWIYTPLDKPRAVVQLIHGFGEHSRRYLHMIDKFTEAGFVVAADDHIAHGKTGYDAGTLGDPGTVGLDGYLVYLKDERSLHDIAAERFPGVPYFMFGHSWGSMLARGYAALYGEDLAGLMLCGVVSQVPGIEELLGDKDFEALIAKGQGGVSGLSWMLRAFSTFCERIAEPISPNDWIANDPRVVADHAGDPFNCFNTNAQLIYDFCALYRFTEDDAWAGMVPARLPVYLTAGDCDPCGNYGEGLYHVANRLAATGHSIKVKAYGGYRHEINNMRETREDVESCLVSFIDSVLL